MKIVVKAFWMPKAGNALDEYEDAFWPQESEQADARSDCLAIADGATESSFSGLWATLLVRAFGRGQLNAASVESELVQLQDEWRQAVWTKPLPWYAEARLREGAFATFLGIRFEDEPDGHSKSGRWNAFAVGDSCLFHIRGPKLIQAFPIETASQFGSRPVLLSSVPANNARLEDVIRNTVGTWEVGDTFYLMTDALACWCHRRLEFLSDDAPLDIFDLIGTAVDQIEFETRISLERNEIAKDGVPMMKNDDVTMVRCTIAESNSGGEDAVADRG